MTSSSRTGTLIVIEGIDGAGKTTIAKRIVSHLERRGRNVVQSKEPTNGQWGRKLRESAQTGRLELEEELEMFLKDRREHVDTLINPTLERGDVVILDRYYFSTAAYQGARGASPASILEQNEEFAPQPDLLILLDLDPSLGLQRIRERGDVPNSFEGVEPLSRAREIFLSIRKDYLRVVNAALSLEKVSDECLALIDEIMDRGS